MAQVSATIMAGVPTKNLSLYHRIRFLVADPCAIIELPAGGSKLESLLIIRDVEMARAKQHACADRVTCPADWTPAGGLSGDRETATAQACAECLRRSGVMAVGADRTLPLIFAHHLAQAGIAVQFDDGLGVLARRSKNPSEIEHLRQAQRDTEMVMRLACETVARAAAGAGGVLMHEGEPLTSERVRSIIDLALLKLCYDNPPSIVAGGPDGGDCHDHGHGPLRTGEPVIIDIFPRHKTTLYNGDCTRTVVHGSPTAELARMHAVVVDAKKAAIAAVRSGATGEAVHAATMIVMQRCGFSRSLPPAGSPATFTSIQHGTGHGIGLDGHEPPLLDIGGPELVLGDALTVEPGLYSRAFGGVRVEDMVIVTATGCENLNSLHEGLDWR